MEQWKDLEALGFPSYEVSTLGRVRNHNYLNSGKTGYNKPALRNDGYVSVILNHQGNRKSYLLHRLVALVFLPNPDNKPEVNHRNHNREDCSVDNLEWATQIENQRHSAHLRTGDQTKKAKLTWDIVRQIREEYSWHSTSANMYTLAEKYDVSPNCIRNIIKGNTWKEFKD